LDAGAAGVAGISMFIDSFLESAQSQTLSEMVSTLKDRNSDRLKITG